MKSPRCVAGPNDDPQIPRGSTKTYLRFGDEVRLSIDGLGEQHQQIVAA
jgi:2-keto-4-pentenoate hydratase/2-oxohepta-3-ene-1,7-dioic acid hydratase in catechol pathway